MEPVIITITGPSCAGKSTLERLLVKRGIAVNAISTTTRPMRTGDVQGESYYFVTREGFEQGLALGNFVEHVEFGGNYYGLSVSEIMRVAERSKPIAVVCEPIGQKQISSLLQGKQLEAGIGLCDEPRRCDCGALSGTLQSGGCVR